METATWQRSLYAFITLTFAQLDKIATPPTKKSFAYFPRAFRASSFVLDIALPWRVAHWLSGATL